MYGALTVKVFEIRELDALAHAENVRGLTEAVQQHPEISSVEGGDLLRCLFAGMAVALKCMLDVCPGRDDGAEDHEPKREQSHAGD